MSSFDGQGGRKRRRVALYATLVAVLAGSLGLRWVLTYEPGVTFLEAPPETRGVWTNSDARYAGRAIEVTATSVVLRRGEAGAVSGQLGIARELIDDDERILRLEYESSEGADAIEIVPMPGGRMYLRNQPDIIWTVGDGSEFRPPAQPTVQTNEPSRPGSPLGPIGPIALVALLIVVLGGGAIMLLNRRGGTQSPPTGPGLAPPIVRGVWETPDGRFAGRSVRIAAGYGFSQFGPGDVRVGGIITSVNQWRDNGSRVVSLQYRTRDGGFKDLEMIIDRSGHMRLGNGPASVWVRRA